jgi:hypothetical protein
MSRKIYKLCLIHGHTEAYNQLTAEQKRDLRAQLDEVLKQAGAKMCGPYYDCKWSNDKFEVWFTMEYPDIDAAIADTQGCQKIQLFRYLISETILGIEAEAA